MRRDAHPRPRSCWGAVLFLPQSHLRLVVGSSLPDTVAQRHATPRPSTILDTALAFADLSAGTGINEREAATWREPGR